MNWYPYRLLIANVGGRAIISDSYMAAEWRRDPWKGFDLPEGNWTRVKRHEYEQTRLGGELVEPFVAVKALRSILKDETPSPKRRVWASIPRTLHITNSEGTQLIPFYGTDRMEAIWVDASLLKAFLHLIDGEPAEWRGEPPIPYMDPHFERPKTPKRWRPLHALDERGRWLGMIMPVSAR